MALSLPVLLEFKVSFVVGRFISSTFALCWIRRLLFDWGLQSVKRDGFCKLIL